MSVDIKGLGGSPSGPRGSTRSTGSAKGGTAVTSTAPDSTSGSDTPPSEVSISSEAQAMQRLASQLSTGNGVDSARVQAIRDALANNTYVINPEKIADKLMQFELNP